MDWCLLNGLVPLQMMFWFTVMLLIVGSGDDTGKSRRYKTGSIEPAASFLHMSLSSGSTLVGLFYNRNIKTINIQSGDVCVCECIFVLKMSCGILPCFHFSVLFTNFYYGLSKWRPILNTDSLCGICNENSKHRHRCSFINHYSNNAICVTPLLSNANGLTSELTLHLAGSWEKHLDNYQHSWHNLFCGMTHWICKKFGFALHRSL